MEQVLLSNLPTSGGAIAPPAPASAGSEYIQKDIESTSAPLKQKEHFEQNLSSANFV